MRDGISSRSTYKESALTSPVSRKKKTVAESMMDRSSAKLLLKSTLFHFWLINNNVTGGPDRPEELAKIPLKEPATIVAIFSFLIVTVLPDIKKNAVISINVDIINLRIYVEIIYSVTIPMGMLAIALVAINAMVFGFNVFLLVIVIA